MRGDYPFRGTHLSKTAGMARFAKRLCASQTLEEHPGSGDAVTSAGAQGGRRASGSPSAGRFRHGPGAAAILAAFADLAARAKAPGSLCAVG